jgi:hypothetical protein
VGFDRRIDVANGLWAIDCNDSPVSDEHRRREKITSSSIDRA